MRHDLMGYLRGVEKKVEVNKPYIVKNRLNNNFNLLCNEISRFLDRSKITTTKKNVKP